MPRKCGGSGGSGHKHHVAKLTQSNYRKRLAKRGLARAPKMTPLKRSYSEDVL